MKEQKKLRWFTEVSKSNICVGFADVTRIRRESGAYVMQMLRAKFASCNQSVMQMLRSPAARGTRNKGCYFWTPLYVLIREVNMNENYKLCKLDRCLMPCNRGVLMERCPIKEVQLFRCDSNPKSDGNFKCHLVLDIRTPWGENYAKGEFIHSAENNENLWNISQSINAKTMLWPSALFVCAPMTNFRHNSCAPNCHPEWYRCLNIDNSALCFHGFQH
jgi:hypothetical protein